MRVFTTFWLYLYVFFATGLTCISIIILSIFGDRQGRLWNPIVHFWASCLLKVAGASPLLVRGLARWPQDQPVVVMANHQSHLDPPSLLATSKQPLRFLAKNTLFYIPVFGQAMWLSGHISINRKHRDSSFRSIDQAAESIANGKTVLIFPEGTRTIDSQMLPFKKGGFVLAIKAKVPILPVGIAGTHEILPPAWGVKGKGSICLVIGEPIQTSTHSLENKELLINEVREAIEALKAEAQTICASHSPNKPTS